MPAAAAATATTAAATPPTAAAASIDVTAAHHSRRSNDGGRGVSIAWLHGKEVYRRPPLEIINTTAIHPLLSQDGLATGQQASFLSLV